LAPGEGGGRGCEGSGEIESSIVDTRSDYTGSHMGRSSLY
jgi:hypothetical protein